MENSLDKEVEKGKLDLILWKCDAFGTPLSIPRNIYQRVIVNGDPSFANKQAKPFRVNGTVYPGFYVTPLNRFCGSEVDYVGAGGE